MALAGTQVLCAQQLPFWRLTDEDGLPSATVYSLLQDAKGYIWMATEGGLCRYDGSRFRYYNIPGAKAIPITGLYEDQHYRIWFHNFSGQLFYVLNEVVHEVKTPPEVALRGFSQYFIDHREHIWLAADKVYCYQPNLQTWETHQIPLPQADANNPTPINSFAVTNEGDLIASYWANDLQAAMLQKGGRVIPLNGLSFQSSYRYRNKLYLIDRTGNRIQEYQDSGKVQTVYQAQDNLIYPRHDRRGNWWICTDNGLMAFDAQLRPLHQPALNLLPGMTIADVMEDREGNLWVATLENGVFVSPVINWLHYTQQNSALPNDRVTALAADEHGQLFVGDTQGLISLLNPKTRTVLYQLKSRQKGMSVHDLYYDAPTKRLLTAQINLHTWDIVGQQELPEVVGYAPKTLSMARNQNLLVAGGYLSYWVNMHPSDLSQKPKHGTYRQRYEGVTQARYTDPNRNYIVLRNVRARTAWADTLSEEAWIGYIDGLFHYDAQGKAQKIRYKNQDIFAYALCKAPDGTLWVGTMTQGLMGIREGRVIHHFDQTKGLVSNFCRTLTADRQYLWIGTDRGLVRYQPATGDYLLINRTDGLIGQEINTIYLQDSYVWVATSKGLTQIDTLSLGRNLAAPPIYITQVSVNEQIVPLQNEYRLPYDQNNIRVDFQGLALRSRGDFRYQYRLLGLSEQWIYTDSKTNFCRYPSLPPGQYILQVRAINEDGVESHVTALINFNINPPLWQKWWFISLTGFLALLVFGLALRWYLARIERRNRIEQDFRSSQLSSLRAQMNPHFIFNALNSIQEFILTNDKLQANRYLGQFADLMRLTLEMSKHEEVSLEEELNLLQLYLSLEALRFEDSLVYQIEVAPDIIPTDLSLPPMLLQPYVENALKHGLLHQSGQRRLWLRFYIEAAYLCCEVEDNGIGREQAAVIRTRKRPEHRSFATGAIQKRLELLNHKRKRNIFAYIDDLHDAQGQPSGTKVVLYIPLPSQN